MVDAVAVEEEEGVVAEADAKVCLLDQVCMSEFEIQMFEVNFVVVFF